MKKSTLLLLSLAMSVSTNLFAQDLPTSPFQGVEVGDCTDVYLYNVNSGMFLNTNRRDPGFWTTRAQLDTKGLNLDITASGDGYVIDGKLDNPSVQPPNHSINDFNLYMDTKQPATEWIFTPVTAGEKTYYSLSHTNTSTEADKGGDWIIAQRDAVGIDGLPLITNKADLAVENGNLWQIITKEELLKNLENATEENPIDVSFLIPNGDFPKNDTRHSSWQGLPTSNVSLTGDNIVNCNAVQEMWALTDLDVYQDIKVPNGTYQFYACACYSDYGSSGITLDYLNAYLDGTKDAVRGTVYANDEEVPMQHFFSIARDSKINYCQKQLGSYWVPAGNGQVSAAMYNGLYQTEPVTVKVTDGNLRVGAKVTEGTGTSWVLIDNFTLKCVGVEKVADAISNVETTATNNRIYNLQGVEVKTANQHGLYIINGKKVIK